MEHFENPSLSVDVAKCRFLRFVVRDRTYMFIYRNSDLDYRIFDCLLTSMAAVQAEDAHAFSCLWVI